MKEETKLKIMGVLVVVLLYLIMVLFTTLLLCTDTGNQVLDYWQEKGGDGWNSSNNWTIKTNIAFLWGGQSANYSNLSDNIDDIRDLGEMVGLSENQLKIIFAVIIIVSVILGVILYALTKKQIKKEVK